MYDEFFSGLSYTIVRIANVVRTYENEFSSTMKSNKYLVGLYLIQMLKVKLSFYQSVRYPREDV